MTNPNKNDTKHTPGPWRIDGQPRPMTSEGRDLLRVDIIGATPADAALIAAAPDLFAALERLASAVEDLVPPEDCPAEVQDARAAIARARGDK